MNVFKNVVEANRAIAANPIAQKTVDVLYEKYTHLLATNPQEALRKAQNDAEIIFVKFAAALTTNFNSNFKLHEAMLSEVFRRIRNENIDTADDEGWQEVALTKKKTLSQREREATEAFYSK